LEQPILSGAGKLCFNRANSLAYLGFYLGEAGDFATAERLLAEAHTCFVRIGTPVEAIEPQAVQARCLAALGRKDEACQMGLEIWNILRERGSEGISFPARVYLSLAEIAQFINVPAFSSREVIEMGYQDLLRRADSISDPEWRRSFLEHVALNQAVVSQWAAMQAV
jgi:hypothetical protein